MNRCYFVVGLSACGKTALGSRLVEFMRDKGMQSILVDGDQMSEFAILKKYNGHDIDSRMQRGYEFYGFDWRLTLWGEWKAIDR